MRNPLRQGGRGRGEGGETERVYVIVFSWNFINVCVSAFSVIIRHTLTSIKIPPGERERPVR
jgi:hypothetical protein